MTKQSNSTSLIELRQSYEAAREELVRRQESLRLEMAEQQRRSLSALGSGDNKGAASARAQVGTLAAALAEVEVSLKDFEVRRAESEAEVATNRAAEIEENLPTLEAAVRAANAVARQTETNVGRTMQTARASVAAADQALRDAHGELAALQHTIGAAKATLARLNPVREDPRVAALPLSGRLARFLVVEPTTVEGKAAFAGQEVLIDGRLAVNISVAAAKRQPGLPAPIVDIREDMAPNELGLRFLRWEIKPSRPEVPLDIPKAEIKPAPIAPAPRHLRVLGACRINGKDYEPGDTLRVDGKTALDLLNNHNVEGIVP